ncbi:uncharacterized protein KY384_001028 [Bacidia gigantensis]|uniref:uncharacterized protein n=1 Tax=Bacidia gigantensis TaxID=2732470 RepID=UPI001D04C32E|nr:uncharacterized protein KY384_001028 [Bacidia gigantensis]KAG8534184.1 hypothetical protein KY384_001028 [Bacidia gigantensis]
MSVTPSYTNGQQAPPEAITRAILSGALQKANDAVHADGDGEWDYAANAYTASCELLGQVMGRLEMGGEEWTRVEGISRAMGEISGRIEGSDADLVRFVE